MNEEELNQTPHNNPDSKFPDLGGAKAECENGHVSTVRNGDFPFVGHCSKCRAQVTWERVSDND